MDFQIKPPFTLPLLEQAVGPLPENVRPWGHLGEIGHSEVPSTASMIQTGRHWIKPDHRWSPTGTTGSPIHLEIKESKRLGEQWTLFKGLNRSTEKPNSQEECLFVLIRNNMCYMTPLRLRYRYLGRKSFVSFYYHKCYIISKKHQPKPVNNWL